MFCIAAYAVSNFYQQAICGRVMQTITWDKFGYYLYLPAFFYDDPARINHLDYLEKTYNTGGNYQAMKAPNGNYIMKYSCGQAIMYLPAFTCAHIAAIFLSYPVDGLSPPYQIAIDIESVLAGILGLVLLRKILRRFYPDTIVAITLIVVALASNYYQYVCFDSAFQHIYLFALYAIIILLTIEWHKQPSYSKSIFLGLCCGLAVLTRPTEIVCVLIPVLYTIHSSKSTSHRFSVLMANWKMVFLFFVTAFLVGSVQLIYWKKYAGSWLYFSYGEGQTFSWLHPHVLSVLFSYKVGWFIYTPVMIFAVIGFITLYKNHLNLFWWVLIFMVAYFYPVAAWDNWTYGGSFSMRAMIESYPMLSFSIASLIEFVFEINILLFFTSFFLAGCIWLNGMFSYQFYLSDKGFFGGETTSFRYYWRIFGKTTMNRNDKKLMDTDEEMPEKYESELKEIYFNDLENENLRTDTVKAFSGKHSIMLTETNQSSPDIMVPISSAQHAWYRVKAKVYAEEMEWNTWMQAQMIVSLKNNDKEVKSKMIRVYRIIDPGKWEDVFIDIDGSIPKPYNFLQVTFWNANSGKTIYIDDLSVSEYNNEK